MKYTPEDTPNAPDDAALIDTSAAGTRATVDDADDAGGTQAHGLAEAPRREQRQHAAQRLWRVEAIYIVALLLFAALAVFARVDPYFAWDLSAERELQLRISVLALCAAERGHADGRRSALPSERPLH